MTNTKVIYPLFGAGKNLTYSTIMELLKPLFNLELINNFSIHNPIISASIGFSAVIATSITVFGFSEGLGKRLKRRRMQHKIAHFKNHYILCGFGRVGQQVAKELYSEREPFVIIERDETKLELAHEHNWPYLIGDVALDESLFEKSNISEAKSIIISVGTDADAIFMAVSARALHKDIFIVARASSIEAADKLSKIGVNRVALPYQIGGYHMATMALRPTVVDFLDLLVDQERNELEMEEFYIREGGFFDGKSLKDSGFIKDGLAVLAIRKKSGKAVINPNDTATLDGGDRLVIMGAQQKLAVLTKEVEKQQPKQTSDEKKEKEAVMVTDIKPSPFLKEE